MKYRFLCVTSLFGILYSFFLWIIGSILENRQEIWLALAILHIAIAAYSFIDLNYNMLLLMFDFTLFYFDTSSFIINGIFDNQIESWAIKYDITWELEYKANTIYLISLFLIFICFHIAKKIRIKAKSGEKYVIPSSVYANNKLMKVSRVVFYIGATAKLIEIIEKTIFVQQTSYLNYYDTFVSHLPTSILRIAGFMLPAFCVFCVCMPDKKEFRKLAIIYLGLGLLSLLYGQRNPFALALIFVVFYVFFRQKYCSNGQVWINSKQIIALVVVLFVIMLLMTGYGFWRNNLSSGNVFKQFFNNMAGESSGFLVLHELNYHDLIPDNHYVFGGVINYFTNNIIGRILGINVSYASNVEYALYGNSYGNTITYLIAPNVYEYGGGMGSNYLAEAFHDFSWFGVVIISSLYGVILSRAVHSMIYMSNRHPYVSACFLMMIQSILYAPRAEALGFITTSLLSWHTMIALIFISLLKRCAI